MALLLTLLTIALLQGLFDGLTSPDTGEFFKFKAIKSLMKSLGDYDLTKYLLLIFVFIIVFAFWWWMLGFLPVPLIWILAIIMILLNILLWSS